MHCRSALTHARRAGVHGLPRGKAAWGGRFSSLTHTDEHGRARMVDVGPKAPTLRRAVAAGRVLVGREVYDLIGANVVKKGDVLSVAQLAGIMGAKHTSTLIPLCHPLSLDHVRVSVALAPQESLAVDIQAEVTTTGRTGVEMEALTAVSVAALTVYDMCKAVTHAMVITNVRLVHKSGGKSLFDAGAN